MGPQARMERIIDLARELVIDENESVRETLRQAIAVHDAIDRRLDEVFDAWAHRDPLTGDQLNR